MRMWQARFLVFLMAPLFLSGCFWNWAWNADSYKVELQQIYTEVSDASSKLSVLVGDSDLLGSQDLNNESFAPLLKVLTEAETKAKNLPSFRGDDAYKNHIVEWVSAQNTFFTKDIVAFLSAPQSASSSSDIQATVQGLYESTKKIKELTVQVESDIASL